MKHKEKETKKEKECKALVAQLPYILAYKSRNFGRILSVFFFIRLIRGSQKITI
jgi:hypothetical protein